MKSGLKVLGKEVFSEDVDHNEHFIILMHGLPRTYI